MSRNENLSREQSLNGLVNPSHTTSHGGKINRTERGIYTVAYETLPPAPFSYRRFIESARDLQEPAAYATRLLRDLFVLAPHLVVTYVMCIIWTSIAPALGLYHSRVLFSIVEESIRHGQLDQQKLELVVLNRLFTTLISVVVGYALNEVKRNLRGHLRAHFLPQMVKANFRSKLFPMVESGVDIYLPNLWNFEEEAPGWEVVEQLSRKAHTALTVASQFIALLFTFSRSHGPEVVILTLFCIVHPITLWFSPKNGAGGGAYVFWTENKRYRRLQTLYNLAFSDNFIKDLATDGTTEYVEREYKQASDALGIVGDSAFSLATNLPRPWYWNLLNDITVDLPLSVYTLTLPWSLSSSSLTSMALLQQATIAIRQSISECLLDQVSLAQVFSVARRLYRTLDFEAEVDRGTGNYSDAATSSNDGMKISFRNVSLKYPEQVQNALEDVCFSIFPGQLVIIVGANGSGKSSMLRLLAKLFNPTSGEILVDDKPLNSFDIAQLRRSMAFLSQNQEIYPLSIRENIQLGLPSGKKVRQEQVDEAARLGGSYDWIQRLPDGFDAILTPLNTVGRSAVGLGHDEISRALQKEWEQHVRREISISGGEKQRLAASRTFLRLCNSDVRLLVVDEPTSALDPVAEHSLFSKFCDLRKGKTMLFVTHRFEHLVKRADMILCLNEGKLVEKGTHLELMDQAGEYMKLYNAQAAAYD